MLLNNTTIIKIIKKEGFIIFSRNKKFKEVHLIMSMKKGVRTLISLLFVMILTLGSTTTTHAASYTSKSFSISKNIVIDSKVVATITEDVTVWFYPDGKVHIYSQNVSYKKVNALCSINLNTPTITNTDGTFSKAFANIELYYLGTTYYISCAALIFSGYTSPSMDIF